MALFGERRKSTLEAAGIRQAGACAPGSSGAGWRAGARPGGARSTARSTRAPCPSRLGLEVAADLGGRPAPRGGVGASAVQGAAHGPAPAARADPDAVALAAAFGVHGTPHASAATIGR